MQEHCNSACKFCLKLCRLMLMSDSCFKKVSSFVNFGTVEIKGIENMPWKQCHLMTMRMSD